MKKLILLLFVLSTIGCQIEPRVLKFRPPSILEETNDALPEIKFSGSQQLKALLSREVNGMDESYLLTQFFGGPHLKIKLDDYNSYVYYFQRVRPGLRPPHDVRQIKSMTGNPPNLAVAITVQDKKVTSAQAPWFDYEPVSISTAERFFGKPDKRSVGANGSEYFYRFVCFTSYTPKELNTSYILNEAVLRIAFTANGNYKGYDLFLVDRSNVLITKNGILDPASNKTWTMRKPRMVSNSAEDNGSKEKDEKTDSLVDLITYNLNGLDKTGEVAAAFGWPSYQTNSNDGKIRTDVYPLKRAGSPHAFMLVRSKLIGDQFEVTSISLKWVGGMPKTPQELRIKFGEPNQIFGSEASGFQRIVYNYRLTVEPFITGHPQQFQNGISVVFSIRSGIKLLEGVEMRKITY